MSNQELEFYANYILDNNLTIRQAAQLLSIPKSTLHYKISKALKKTNYRLYLKLHAYLACNFENKHIRGGIATRKMWAKKRTFNSKQQQN